MLSLLTQSKTHTRDVGPPKQFQTSKSINSDMERVPAKRLCTRKCANAKPALLCTCKHIYCVWAIFTTKYFGLLTGSSTGCVERTPEMGRLPSVTVPPDEWQMCPTDHSRTAILMASHIDVNTLEWAHAAACHDASGKLNRAGQHIDILVWHTRWAHSPLQLTHTRKTHPSPMKKMMTSVTNTPGAWKLCSG